MGRQGSGGRTVVPPVGKSSDRGCRGTAMPCPVGFAMSLAQQGTASPCPYMIFSTPILNTYARRAVSKSVLGAPSLLCHSERSEESRPSSALLGFATMPNRIYEDEILRFAQNDKGNLVPLTRASVTLTQPYRSSRPRLTLTHKSS